MGTLITWRQTPVLVAGIRVTRGWYPSHARGMRCLLTVGGAASRGPRPHADGAGVAADRPRVRAGLGGVWTTQIDDSDGCGLMTCRTMARGMTRTKCGQRRGRVRRRVRLRRRVQGGRRVRGRGRVCGRADFPPGRDGMRARERERDSDVRETRMRETLGCVRETRMCEGERLGCAGQPGRPPCCAAARRERTPGPRASAGHGSDPAARALLCRYGPGARRPSGPVLRGARCERGGRPPRLEPLAML